MSALTHLTRRRFGQIMLGAAAASALPLRDALADVPTDTPLHGLSAFGELKYGPDFTHFDYATPDAPQGGQLNFRCRTGCSISRRSPSTR